jgi:predicted XRE-type DNA-binding protein
MSETLEVVRGSGNVFADFGDADADAKQLKAQMAAEIIATLDKQGLTARAGATRAGVDPADIQRIRNGDLSRFTLDRLIRVAYRLGRRVEMKVVAAPTRVAVAQ